MQHDEENSNEKNNFSETALQLYRLISQPNQQGYYDRILGYLESDQGVKKIFESSDTAQKLIISGITKAQFIENAVGILSAKNAISFTMSDMLKFLRLLKKFEEYKEELTQFFNFSSTYIFPKDQLPSDYESYMKNLLQKISEFVSQYSDQIDRYIDSFFGLSMVIGQPNNSEHTAEDILKLYSKVFAESLKYKVISINDLKEYIYKLALYDVEKQNELVSTTLQDFVHNQHKPKLENELNHLVKAGIITDEIAQTHLNLLSETRRLVTKSEKPTIAFSESWQIKKNHLVQLCSSLILELKKLGMNTELLQETYITRPVLSSSQLKSDAAIAVCNLITSITYIYVVQSNKPMKDKINYETLKTLLDFKNPNGRVQLALWPYLRSEFAGSKYIEETINKINEELEQLIKNHWQLIKPLIKKIKKKDVPNIKIETKAIEEALSHFKIEKSSHNPKKHKKKTNESSKQEKPKEKPSEPQFKILSKDDPIFINKNCDKVDEEAIKKGKEIELQKAQEIALLNKIAASSKIQQESTKKKKFNPKPKKKNKHAPSEPQSMQTKTINRTQAVSLPVTTAITPFDNATELRIAEFALHKKEHNDMPKSKTKCVELPKELKEVNLALEALISIIKEENSNRFEALLGCLIVSFNFLAEFCLKNPKLELKDSNFLDRNEISKIRNLLVHYCIYADNSIMEFAEHLLIDFKPRLNGFSGKFLHKDKLTLLNLKFVTNLKEKKKTSHELNDRSNIQLLIDDLQNLNYSMKSIDSSSVLQRHLANSYVVISFLFKLDVRTRLFSNSFKFSHPELVYLTAYYRNQIGHPTMTFKDPRYAHDSLFIDDFKLNYEKLFNIAKKASAIKKSATHILNALSNPEQKPAPKQNSTTSVTSSNNFHHFFKNESRQSYPLLSHTAFSIETEKKYAVRLIQALYSSLVQMKDRNESAVEEILFFHSHVGMLKPEHMEMIKNNCDESTMQLLVDLQKCEPNYFNPENFNSRIDKHLDKLIEMSLSVYNELLSEQPGSTFQNG